MLEQFHDLKFERLPCGTVRMTQAGNAGGLAVIDAHPTQIIHAARVLVGARVNPEAKRIQDLERRIRWLHDRFFECYEELPVDRFFREYSQASEFYAWLNASVDVAIEYCVDLTPEIETANTVEDHK